MSPERDQNETRTGPERDQNVTAKGDKQNSEFHRRPSNPELKSITVQDQDQEILVYRTKTPQVCHRSNEPLIWEGPCCHGNGSAAPGGNVAHGNSVFVAVATAPPQAEQSRQSITQSNLLPMSPEVTCCQIQRTRSGGGGAASWGRGLAAL